MELFDFAVLKGDEIIEIEPGVALPHLKAAWARVAQMAQRFDRSGYRIRVTNQRGEIVILAGVSIARELALADAGMPPPFGAAFHAPARRADA